MPPEIHSLDPWHEVWVPVIPTNKPYQLRMPSLPPRHADSVEVRAAHTNSRETPELKGLSKKLTVPSTDGAFLGRSSLHRTEVWKVGDGEAEDTAGGWSTVANECRAFFEDSDPQRGGP